MAAGFQMTSTYPRRLPIVVNQQARRRGVDQLREGVVVRPQVERTDPEIGRIQLKLVSDKYLERG